MEKISILKEKWLKKEIANLKEKGISKADIACKLEIKPQYLNNILNGGRGITDAFLDKFIEEFNIIQFDLLHKEADPIIESAIIYKSDPKDIAIIADKQTIINRDAEILASNKDTIEIQKKLILSLEQRIKELEHSSPNSKTSGFHSVQSVDTTNPSQTGAKAKQPNK